MGIGRQEIERMASALEHEDPGAAIRRRRPPPRGTHENARSEHQIAHFVRSMWSPALCGVQQPEGLYAEGFLAFELRIVAARAVSR